MKVFLSWSGEPSLKIALIFRDWLPAVIQAVKPYVSSEDIDKGTRWSTDSAKELEASSYGILCVTEGNLEAPWINFEAGALSKAIDKANVSPFLFNVKRSEIQGPLLQFQSTVNEKDDVCRLVASVNRRLVPEEKLDDTLLAKSFEVWWPKLQEQLDEIPVATPATPVARLDDSRQRDAILEELLELARTQQKILRSPEALIPPGYLEWAFRHARRDATDSPELHDVVVALEQLVHEIRAAAPDSVTASRVEEHLGRLHRITHRDRDRPRLGIRRKTIQEGDKKVE